MALILLAECMPSKILHDPHNTAASKTDTELAKNNMFK